MINYWENFLAMHNWRAHEMKRLVEQNHMKSNKRPTSLNFDRSVVRSAHLRWHHRLLAISVYQQMTQLLCQFHFLWYFQSFQVPIMLHWDHPLHHCPCLFCAFSFSMIHQTHHGIHAENEKWIQCDLDLKVTKTSVHNFFRSRLDISWRKCRDSFRNTTLPSTKINGLLLFFFSFGGGSIFLYLFAAFWNFEQTLSISLNWYDFSSKQTKTSWTVYLKVT